MTITIRERKPKNGEKKLYLDIYNPAAKKQRTSKTLDLVIYDKPTKAQKKLNAEAMEAAKVIRSKMLVDLAYENNDLSGLSKKDKSDVDFIEYFRQQTDMVNI